MTLLCRHRPGLLIVTALWLAAFLSCQATAREKSGSGKEKAFEYWTETRKQPRDLHIHYLKVDLRNPGHEVIAMIADPPEGGGPADARLEEPVTLATAYHALAAVNTNAFGALPNEKGERDRNWTLGKPVDVLGWAEHSGRQMSTPQSGYMSFWISPDRRAHIGRVHVPEKAREAVAGFGPLLTDGRKCPGDGGALHPRTALGLDGDGRWLYLVVVDGRQPGFSMGMSEGELADLMQGLGCTDAMNLDGGGSSIMLVSDGRGGDLKVMNRPSDGKNRPVPVMLGVRERKRR